MLPRIFISYSRKDKDLAAALVAELKAVGHEVFQDTSDIPYGAAWRDWIRQEIGRADVVLIMVSGHWLASRHCREELDIAVDDHKRLLPLAVDVTAEQMPAVLADLQLVSATAPPPALAALVREGACVDLDWLVRHRRLLQEAQDWLADGRRAGRLMADATLHALDAALQVRARPDPSLGPAQLEFIAASRRAAQRRRRNRLLLGVAAGGLILAALAVAWVQAQRRADQAAQASARGLLQVAVASLSPQQSPNAALRLALAARQQAPLPEVNDFMQAALAQMPLATWVMPNLPGPVGSEQHFWNPRAVLRHTEGRATYAVFEDGRRHNRFMVHAEGTKGPQGPQASPRELAHQLPPGWVGAVASHAARIVFQPEPAQASVSPGSGDAAWVLALPSLAAVDRFELPGDGPLTTAMDAGGRFLALCRDRQVQLWQIEPRRLVGRWQATAPATDESPWRACSHLVVHPDGRRVVLAPDSWVSGKAPLWLLDLGSANASLQLLALLAEGPQALVLSRLGLALAASERLGKVRVFKAQADLALPFVEAQSLSLQAVGGGLRHLALSDDGSQLAVTMLNTEVYDLATGQRTAFMEGGGPMVFGGLGSTVWTTDTSNSLASGRLGMLVQWSLPTAADVARARLGRVLGGRRINAFDFATGSHDIVASTASGMLRIVPDTGGVRAGWPAPQGQSHWAAAPAPSAGAVRFPRSDGGVLVGPDGPEALPDVNGLDTAIQQVLVSADGRRTLLQTVRVLADQRNQVALASVDVDGGRVDSRRELVEAYSGARLLVPVVARDWIVRAESMSQPAALPDGARKPASAPPAVPRPCAALVVLDARALERRVASLPCSRPDEVLVGTTNRSGDRLLLVSEERVIVLALPGLATIREFARPRDAISNLPRALAWSADERQIAVMDDSRKVTVYNASGEVLLRLPFERDSNANLNAVRFSDDGQWLAANVGDSRGVPSLYAWRTSSDALLTQVCARLAGTRAATDVNPVLRSLPAENGCTASMAASKSDRPAEGSGSAAQALPMPSVR